MSNLTIAVDDGVIKQARIRAIQEGTSVSAKLREYLAGYAAGETGPLMAREDPPGFGVVPAAQTPIEPDWLRTLRARVEDLGGIASEAEAQERLSEVVKRAEGEGPQDITQDGRSVAVVLSRAAFERLCGQQASLADFMQASPLVGLDDELVFERDTSPVRDVEF